LPSLTYIVVCESPKVGKKGITAYEIMPFWAVDHMDIFDQDVFGLEYGKSDWTQKRRVRCTIFIR
jgi:hypothetical protein